MADDDQLQVELVAADRLVWSGEATMVIARTTEGDVGILREPRADAVAAGRRRRRDPTAEGETVVAAVDAGFLSVANNRVSILSEHAEMSHEIDLEKARAELERPRPRGENDDEAQARSAAPRHASGPPSGLLTERSDAAARVARPLRSEHATEGMDAGLAVAARRRPASCCSSSCSTASP